MSVPPASSILAENAPTPGVGTISLAPGRPRVRATSLPARRTMTVNGDGVAGRARTISGAPTKATPTPARALSSGATVSRSGAERITPIRARSTPVLAGRRRALKRPAESVLAAAILTQPSVERRSMTTPAPARAGTSAPRAIVRRPNTTAAGASLSRSACASIWVVAVAVPPSASVTVRTTVKLPARGNRCATDCPAPVVPSPNDQA